MATISSITTRLFNISSEIESINQQEIQLQLRRDRLLEERKKLRKELERLEAESGYANWRVGQQMTADLLNKELGNIIDL